MKLLFTCTGRRIELMQAFRAAAEKTGLPLTLFGADASDTAPALRFCDEAILLPRISSADYLPALERVCREQKIDAVIPTIDTDLLLLSQNRPRLEALGTRVFIGDPDKIALCRDKRFTADYLIGLGLNSPQPVDDVTAYHGPFPAFIKPKDGSSSINAHSVRSEQELAFLAQQVPNYIIQPFISGVEYTVDAFCDYDGNPILITPRIRLEVRAGEVLKTEIAQDAQIIEETKRLLADFRPRGAITVQLIRDRETGTDHFIEINPRFGGGAPLSIKAGADSAEMLLRSLNGETLPYFPNAAEDGAVFSRFDQSVRIR